jgi:hypothetical protein
MELLTTLRSERIVGVSLHPYNDIGFDFLDLYCASGRVLRVNAIELENTPFDAYSLEVTEIQRDEADNIVPGIDDALVQLQVNHNVDHIDMFHRSEWEVSDPTPFPTVGRNPRTVFTGPIGSAPSGSQAVTVVSAVALRSEDQSQSSMLIFVNDFPTWIGFSTAENDVARVRSETSSETV